MSNPVRWLPHDNKEYYYYVLTERDNGIKDEADMFSERVGKIGCAVDK